MIGELGASRLGQELVDVGPCDGVTGIVGLGLDSPELASLGFCYEIDPGIGPPPPGPVLLRPIASSLNSHIDRAKAGKDVPSEVVRMKGPPRICDLLTVLRIGIGPRLAMLTRSPSTGSN